MTSSETIAVSGAVAGLLRVTGEDAFNYLQSQFSNDLRRPGVASPVTYGLWLTRKGKVAADSLVVRLGADELLLISFNVPTDKLSEKVLENVIADDVEAMPVTWPVLTVAGPGAKASLGALGITAPGDGEFSRAEGLLAVASRRGGVSYEVFATSPEAAAKLRIHDTNTDVSALESLRIASGVPRVPEDCGPGDLPQEAGLDADAVSFTKGCYLGQEVMARLQSQGRANRALTRLLIEKGAAAEVCAKLYVGGVEAGEIRSKANIGAGPAVMAMLRIRVSDLVGSFSDSPGGVPVYTRLPAS